MDGACDAVSGRVYVLAPPVGGRRGRALLLTAFTRSFRLGKAWDGKPRPKTRPTGDGGDCDEWMAKATDWRHVES